MDRRMLLGAMLVLVVMCLSVVSTMPDAWAHHAEDHVGSSRHVGDLCWQVAPFDDTLAINVAQVHVPWQAEQWFFVYTMFVNGDGVYALHGGGSAPYGFDGLAFDVLTIQSTLRNTHTMAFGGNPICTLSASLTGATMEGPFALRCEGLTHVGKPPYLVSGTLKEISCQTFNAKMSVQEGIASQASGRLAGFR